MELRGWVVGWREDWQESRGDACKQNKETCGRQESNNTDELSFRERRRNSRRSTTGHRLIFYIERILTLRDSRGPVRLRERKRKGRSSGR